MPSLAMLMMGFHACGHVDSTLVPPVFSKQRGFVNAVTKNGVGDYTLTMSQGLPTNDNLVFCQVQDQGGGGSRGNITVESVSDTQLRVRTFLAGVPADQHFWIGVIEIGPD